MTIKGLLNGHEARMLIDSGASVIFVNAQFLDNGRETLAACMSDTSLKSVKLANGTTVQANQMLANVNTNVKNRTLSTSFVVLPQLSNSYDAILEIAHLEAAHPGYFIQPENIPMAFSEHEAFRFTTAVECIVNKIA